MAWFELCIMKYCLIVCQASIWVKKRATNQQSYHQFWNAVDLQVVIGHSGFVN